MKRPGDVLSAAIARSPCSTWISTLGPPDRLVRENHLLYSNGVLPPFELETGNLPPGVHAATWLEVAERFGLNPHRRRLLTGLERALRALRQFGCRMFYLDGSFVTAKEPPGDWDGCWEAEGVDVFLLATEAPLLWDDTLGRPGQKAEYGGDIFPVRIAGDEFDRRILENFQIDWRLKRPKGIVAIDLGTLP